ncbi:hypothetical protein Holit_00642 [Hollandina sp. SP2]
MRGVDVILKEAPVSIGYWTEAYQAERRSLRLGVSEQGYVS